MKNTMIIICLLCVVRISAEEVSDNFASAEQELETADLVGIWGPDNLDQFKGGWQLGPPREILAGSADILDQLSASPAVRQAAGEISKGKALCLLLRVGEQGAEVVVVDRVPLLHSVILKKRWAKLSIKEKVAGADLILFGSVIDDAEDGGSQKIKVESIQRGHGPVERGDLLHVDPDGHRGRMLFFLRRPHGTGQKYILLDAVPPDEAAVYTEFISNKRAMNCEPQESGFPYWPVGIVLAAAGGLMYWRGRGLFSRG